MYRFKSFERIPKKYVLNRKDVGVLETVDSLLKMICSKDVGINIAGLEKEATENRDLVSLLTKFVRKFQSINFFALLNKHCVVKKGCREPTDPIKVYLFLNSVIFNSNIHLLFGDQVNRAQRIVKQYIMKTLSSKITIGDLMTGMSMQKVPWLSKFSSNTAKTNIFAKFLHWFVSDFLKPIVSSFFHCSDSTHRKYKVFFYRKSVWQSLVDQAIHREVKSGKLKVLDDTSSMKMIQSHLAAPAPATLRFIPKKSLTEVRLICRTTAAGKLDPSLAQLVRSYAAMYGSRADLSGQTLAREWSRLVAAVSPAQPLFWLTADIRDAFGSVRLARLVAILQQCAAASRATEDRARTEAVCRRLVLHTGQLRVGGRSTTFLARRGLLQGDSLSPPLSDLYYGHMVATQMQQFTSAPPHATEIFLRGADDFIFVSTDRTRVLTFREAIRTGFPSYNCTFEPAKTVTNVDSGDQEHDVRYCGAVLSLRTREVAPNYSAYPATNLASLQSWRLGARRPAQFIRRRFLLFCCVRQTSLYLGPYNGRARLLETLAANVSLALRRLACMLDTLVWTRRRRADPAWLARLLLAGLRRFRGSSVRAGLHAATVETVALLCLRLELRRSSQFPGEVRRMVESSLAKYPPEKVTQLLDTVTRAHEHIQWNTIVAKCGYKHLG